MLLCVEASSCPPTVGCFVWSGCDIPRDEHLIAAKARCCYLEILLYRHFLEEKLTIAFFHPCFFIFNKFLVLFFGCFPKSLLTRISPALIRRLISIVSN